ncbi:MAG TPA: tRNA-dihydrouridine synthase family protein [Deltaproteobacteria bacterium]|nr:tRNA-dihydrouridine synthase family protein [Deltaproteobacteria bacterium]HPR54255.1 tRNA-dihydrouridine synthase family protein [Deltaproteobacteria bacterium]HXK45833.1 tRNA-dihydrouridine synthase family protein [Deltaproteobacteria bacterium]
MAPMVDLSHVAFQELVRSFPGCDFLYSEMLNARIVPVEKPGTSLYLKWTGLDDLIFQICGNDPVKMQESAARLDGIGPFGIDVNMGCWLKKVTCHGWGAGLLRDAARAREVVTAVREAVHRPLSVKMRIGYTPDVQALRDFASMLEDCGVDFIVLHARTVDDGMARKARWEYIAALKDHVKVPVVGNGDIKSAEDALNMFSATGCDGIMVGRQAVIQPWIFRDIKALFAGTEVPPPPPLMDVMLDLLRLLGIHFPPDVALKRFKTAMAWLSQNLTFGHHLAKSVGREKTMEGAATSIRKAFEDGIS